MKATKAVLAFSNGNGNGECNVPKGRKFCFYTSHMRARFQFDLFLSSRAKHSAEITLSLLAYLWSFQFFLSLCTTRVAWSRANKKTFLRSPRSLLEVFLVTSRAFSSARNTPKLNNISRTDRLPQSCRKWEMLNFFRDKKRRKISRRENLSSRRRRLLIERVGLLLVPRVPSRYACALTRRDVDGNGIGNSERRIYTSINVITRRRAARHDEPGRV